jgi:aspartyl-tRNA(Asn)/glutamyl-tRNA(Gln) amidotransferase subunit B
LNTQQIEIGQFPINTDGMAGLVEMVKSGKVSHSAAATGIFDEMTKNPAESPAFIAQRLNLLQQSDVGQIEQYAREVVDKYPEKAEEFRNGKKGLIGFFMGETMKLSKGNLDPQLTNKILTELLKK